MIARAAASLVLSCLALACSAAADDAARPAVDDGVQGAEWVDPGSKCPRSWPYDRQITSPECSPLREPGDWPAWATGDAGTTASPGKLPKPRD